MLDTKESLLTSDVRMAMAFARFVKWLKVVMAFLVVFAYLTSASWLTEIIVLSVVISLVMPLGFFDVFIQKLLEYNTRKLEECQMLNATEANEHFEKIYKKLDKKP